MDTLVFQVINKTNTEFNEHDMEKVFQSLNFANETSSYLHTPEYVQITDPVQPDNQLNLIILFEGVEHNPIAVTQFTTPIINHAINSHLEIPLDDHVVDYMFYPAGDGGIVTARVDIDIEGLI